MNAFLRSFLAAVGTFAIACVRELAGIQSDEKIKVLIFPVKQDLVQMVLSGGGDLGLRARWSLYRSLRAELNQSMNVMTNARLNVAPIGQP